MISVVVPVYNTGKFLPKLIDSLLYQTYKDYEIIIVDDGCNDESSEICNQQKDKNSNISVYHKENGGVSSARNLGIEKAKGDYIIFPDSDDWVDHDYLEKLYNNTIESGSDLTICGYYFTSDDTDVSFKKNIEQKLLQQEEALLMLVSLNGFQGYAWNKLYNLSVIKKENFRFDTELKAVQDLHFAVRYFLNCKTVYLDTTPLYHYRRDTGGVTTFTKLGERQLSGIITFEKIMDLLHDTHPEAEKMIRSSCSWWILRLIQTYFKRNVKDTKLLKYLKNKFRKYLYYFLKNKCFSKKRRLCGAIAAFSPKLYYKLLSKYGHLSIK
ncbi:MAG: glycosyltransferase [Treponema sp.]|nr:glycosyltransferase [Treponema sp.]